MINHPSTPTDLGDIPYPVKNDVAVFIGGIGTGGSNNNWKIWNKPKGSTMTYIIAIGGGGGGGAGVVSGGDKGGGAGGGSGAINRLLIPSFFLPEILYVLAGDGGQGGLASGNAGTAGGISYAAFTPSTSLARSILIQSNNAAAGGGGAGTTTTAAGGAGGTAAIATMFGSTLGTDANGIAGQAGANAPSGAGNNPGNSVTAWSSIPLSGGASGGSTTGTNTAGGAITAAAAISGTYINWPTTAGAVAAGGTAGTGNGSSGVNLLYPFLTSGGAGGGSNDNGAAGGGGAGGIGSGGGGGGGADSAGGQRGGNGGPGMVMIISW